MCEDYNKGFCEKGPRCPNRHVPRKLCEFYLAGFCPDGKECKHGVHLKSGGPAAGDKEKDDENRRRDRVTDMEKREDDQRKEFGWKGGRGGKSGRWRNKRDRDRR